jgi:flagellar basal body rod protein FlgF
MSQTELEAYSNQLLKTTADLNQKERDLAAVEPKIELKPSSLLYESLIGSLSTLIDSNKNTDRDFELQRLCIRQVSANPHRIRQVFILF